MTRKQLYDKVERALNCNPDKARFLTDLFFSSMKEALVKEGKLSIKDFFTFEVVDNRRKPNSGVVKRAKNKKKIRANPSESLKEKLNG